MPVEVVLDASSAAKIFITETGSDAVRALASSGVRLIAPDLVLVELTNVAMKRLRKKQTPRAVSERMVAVAHTIFDELISARELVQRAFVLAADHAISTYDATYVALAERRGCDLVTNDLKLIASARLAGLPIVVREP